MTPADRTPAAGSGRRAHHGNRHGRSEEGRRAVLHAADGLLVQHGFDGVTMEGIARRAGVAKQTVYRWWRTTTEVLLEAFLRDEAEDLLPPDSGDVVVDLGEYLPRVAAFLDGSESGAVFRALVGRAQLDPVFGRDFRSRYLDPQRLRAAVTLHRAVARGQLPADLDVAAEMGQLVGPLFYRVLVTGEPAGREFTDRLVRSFLRRHGLEPPPAGSDPEPGR